MPVKKRPRASQKASRHVEEVDVRDVIRKNAPWTTALRRHSVINGSPSGGMYASLKSAGMSLRIALRGGKGSEKRSATATFARGTCDLLRLTGTSHPLLARLRTS